MTSSFSVVASSSTSPETAVSYTHLVALFAKYVGPNVKIKAAGGIANLQDAEDFINLGASRLGTSRIVKAVKNMPKHQ